MSQDSTVVATFSERHTAEIAQGFLEDAGVESALAADDAGAQIPGFTLGSQPAMLLVRADDAERARRILQEAGMLESDGGEPGA